MNSGMLSFYLIIALLLCLYFFEGTISQRLDGIEYNLDQRIEAAQHGN